MANAKYYKKYKAEGKAWYQTHKEESREYKKEWYKKNKEKQREKIKNYYSQVENRKKKLLWKAKERAIKENIEFNITLEDISIPEKCPYLGVLLTHTLGEGQLESNSSLDRIDSTKGYIKGNVQVISRLANTMKSNADVETLLLFAKGILNVHYSD